MKSTTLILGVFVVLALVTKSLAQDDAAADAETTAAPEETTTAAAVDADVDVTTPALDETTVAATTEAAAATTKKGNKYKVKLNGLVTLRRRPSAFGRRTGVMRGNRVGSRRVIAMRPMAMRARPMAMRARAIAPRAMGGRRMAQGMVIRRI